MNIKFEGERWSFTNAIPAIGVLITTIELYCQIFFHGDTRGMYMLVLYQYTSLAPYEF